MRRSFTTHLSVVHALDLKWIVPGEQVNSKAAHMLAHRYDEFAVNQEPEGGPSPFIETEFRTQDYRPGTKDLRETHSFDMGDDRITLAIFADSSAVIEWTERGSRDIHLVPWVFDTASAFNSPSAPDIERIDDEVYSIVTAFKAATPLATGHDYLNAALAGTAAVPRFAHNYNSDACDIANRFIIHLELWFRHNRPAWGNVEVSILGRFIYPDGVVTFAQPKVRSDLFHSMPNVDRFLIDVLDREDCPLPLVAQVRCTGGTSLKLGYKAGLKHNDPPSTHEQLAALRLLDPIMWDCPWQVRGSYLE